MGEYPSWYSLVVAARYLGVPPWELAQRPSFWRDIALMSKRSEDKAQEQLNKH